MEVNENIYLEHEDYWIMLAALEEYWQTVNTHSPESMKPAIKQRIANLRARCREVQ
jgi:hypothetical protein